MSTRKLAERRSLLPAVTLSEGEEEEPPKDRSYGQLCLSLSEGMITTTLADEGDDTTSQEEKGSSTQKVSDDDKPRPSVGAWAVRRKIGQ